MVLSSTQESRFPTLNSCGYLRDCNGIEDVTIKVLKGGPVAGRSNL